MKSAQNRLPPLRESDIQTQIVAALSYHAWKHKYIFFSVPNEHDLSASGNKYARMTQLKKMGFTPGVADLVIVKAGVASFLEVKTPAGEVSDNQRRFMSAAVSAGAHCTVVRSYEQAISVLKQWEIFA